MVHTFRIELFPAQNVYFPGQIVKGQCILSLRQRIKARSVIVNLVGKAKTDINIDGVNSENKKQNDDHSAEVLYMNNMIAVWLPSQHDQKFIEVGAYEWPFTFTLPTECPPSFEGLYGYVRYWALATIDRPWQADDMTRTFFTVMPMFDLNMVPYAASPINRQFSKTVNLCCCYSKGHITVNAIVSKTGVVPGETLNIHVAVSNRSLKTVYKIWYSLMQNIKNYAANTTITDNYCIWSYYDSLFVPPGSTQTYECSIKVPPIVPSIGSTTCSIIQVSYSVKIRIGVSGIFISDPTCKIPILVGTIPADDVSNSVKAPTLCDLQPPAPTIMSEDDINQVLFKFVDSSLRGGLQGMKQYKELESYIPKYVYYGKEELEEQRKQLALKKLELILDLA